MTTARLPKGKKSLTPHDQAIWSPVTFPGATALTKGDRILAGDHFTAEADELPSGRTDLEFVTSLPPFPETRKGRDALIATMTAIANMAAHLEANKDGNTKRGFQATELGAFGTPKMKDVVIGPPINTPVTASPQSTAAVRLGQLAEMMRQLGTPTGVGGAVAPPVNPKHAPGQQDLMGMSGGDRDIMGEAIALADHAIAGYPHWPTIKGHAHTGSAELSGLVALVLTYLLRGDRENLSYAKNISILLARTNFAAMFKQLPKIERRALSGNSGAEWSDFVLDAAGLTGTDNTPVFVHGLHYDPSKLHLLDDVTRGKWLTKMACGTDILTASKIGSGRSKEMESLGRLGSRKERVGTGGAKASAPIFEFRRMRSSVPHGEWSPLALNVFDYVRAMNNLVATRYKRKNTPGNIQPST